MTNELLTALGIDPGLPAQRVLELLQDKNLELLERLDACTDIARADDLRARQREVEEAILACSTGLTLDRRIRSREEASAVRPGPDAAAQDRLGQALLDYQAGRGDAALPVLLEHAEQGDALACMLSANLLFQAERNREAKRCLFIAAQGGDGTAALLLAQQYFQEDNFVYAWKWARTALERETPGAAKLLARIAQREKRPLDGLDPLEAELARATGYDRFDLLRTYFSLVDSVLLSDKSQAAPMRARLNALRPALEGDGRCAALLDERTRRSKASSPAAFTLVNGILGSLALTGLLHVVNAAIPGARYFPGSLVWGYVFTLLCGVGTRLLARVYARVNKDYRPAAIRARTLLLLPAAICLPGGLLVLLFSTGADEFALASPLGCVAVLGSLVCGAYGSGLLSRRR